MKKTGKLMALALSAAAIFSASACGDRGPRGDSADTLYIRIFDGGYGTAFVDAATEIFNEKYPDIKVEVEPTVYDEQFATNLLSGVTSTDLFFGRKAMFEYMYDSFRGQDGTIYECALADLSDVYESEVDGQKVKDKLLDEYVRANEFTRDDGTVKYYTFPWVRGMLGILKNNKVWKDSWEIPNTTNELLALCEQIKRDSCTPFIYSLNDSYYYIFEPIFVAQYEGVERMEQYWAGYNASGQRYNSDFLVLDGQLESLKVMEDLLKASNGYQHEASYSIDFTATQNMFLEDSNNIAMMVNGDWIEREMRANYSPEETDIEFIKTPVISALGTKLGIGDSTLSAIIDYVDGTVTEAPVFTSSEGLSSQEVIEKVRAARSLEMTNSDCHCCWIPAYSNMVDYAKEFLKILASDEGIRAFSRATFGYSAPYQYNILDDPEVAESSSDFIKSTLRLMNRSTVYWPDYSDRIFALGKLTPHTNGQNGFETYFSATSDRDFLSAETYYTRSCTYAASMWQNYRQRAGIAG